MKTRRPRSLTEKFINLRGDVNKFDVFWEGGVFFRKESNIEEGLKSTILCIRVYQKRTAVQIRSISV